MKTITFLLCLFAINLFAQTVYVTNSGKKYHAKTCHYLSKSFIPIELSKAKAQGYTACSKCQKGTIIKSNNNTIKSTPVELGQCTATTKKGTRCKRKATKNGKCTQHN